MSQSFDALLRGQDGELGLIGWVVVLRRTWVALVALLSTAIGYFLNDAVNPRSVGREPPHLVQGAER